MDCAVVPVAFIAVAENAVVPPPQPPPFPNPPAAFLAGEGTRIGGEAVAVDAVVVVDVGAKATGEALTGVAREEEEDCL